MSWGTLIKPEIYLLRRHFSSKGEVELSIKERKHRINSIWRELSLLAAIDPALLIEQDSEGNDLPIISTITTRIDELKEELESEYQMLFEERYLLDDEVWNTKEED